MFRINTVWLLATAVCLSSNGGCTSDGGSSEPYECKASASQCLTEIAGEYEGTYSGATKGEWSATIDTDGTLSGHAYNTVVQESYGLTGNANKDGEAVFGTSSDGAAFRGQISSEFRISGTWTLSGHSGTFRGKRVSGYQQDYGVGGMSGIKDSGSKDSGYGMAGRAVSVAGTVGGGGTGGIKDSGSKDSGGGTDVSVATVTDAVTCKAVVKAAQQSSALTDCLCEKCLANFGACVADTNCLALVACMAQTGCTGVDCVSDPTCGSILMTIMNTNSFTTVSVVLSCQASQCATVDGGSGTGAPSGAGGSGGSGASSGT